MRRARVYGQEVMGKRLGKFGAGREVTTRSRSILTKAPVNLATVL
jgi:hypothetical protein